MNHWFRLYSEFATDPKVQMMSEADQRRFVMLLCIRCSNGDVTLHDEEVAFQLRISNEEWSRSKALFVSKNLIDDCNRPTKWDKRQFVSDSSAARVARHREKKKRVCNVTVTPPDTDTDTDTDTELTSKALGPASPATAQEKKQRVVRKAVSMPAEFQPDETGVGYAESRNVSLATELESFRNWHAAKGSTMRDWQAAWRTWCDKAVEFGRARTNGKPPPNGYQRPPTLTETRAATHAALTGKTPLRPTNERTERDITGEVRRLA